MEGSIFVYDDCSEVENDTEENDNRGGKVSCFFTMTLFSVLVTEYNATL